MKETSSDPPDIEPKRSGALSKAYGFFRSSSTPSDGPTLPLTEPTHRVPASDSYSANVNAAGSTAAVPDNHVHNGSSSDGTVVDEKQKPSNGPFNTPGQLAPPASSQAERQGSVVKSKDGTDNTTTDNNNDINDGSIKKKRTFMEEFRRCAWMIITHSWLNVLLVFVPIGIAVAQIEGIHGGIVFAMNCIAVIPLAGLLSHATESVAHKMGDALGALLNVTFGNAVELIIFIIALTKDQIRIVQASLLGSILANLLLILGMAFFLGGLRFREQIYNSTVTQMSACLLSLSVISLVLPTAFHASFKNTDKADAESLKISRGTSVILLLVYIIYLLFQLKSHAYMYESTPQHIVDAESTPGPAAAWLESSDSDDSSSSSSDSDDSDRSRDTMKMKMKKVLRGRRNRKSSIASVDTDTNTRSSSFATNPSPQDEGAPGSSTRPNLFPPASPRDASEEAIDDDASQRRAKKRHFHRRKHRKSKKKGHRADDGGDLQPTISERPENGPDAVIGENEPRRVDFAVQDHVINDTGNESGAGGATKRPFPALRGMSVKNLAPTVFVQKPDPGVAPVAPAGPVPRIRYGIRRTNSLPDKLNMNQHQVRPPGAMLPSQIPLMSLTGGNGAQGDADEDDQQLPQAASIVLLLVSTALVAVCAEFLIGSIEEVTSTSSVGETFIGLIVLPIVGNAAEHVTALTVAMKNKMDLAIGVAVGSSIQIALFITPLVVILGWIMEKEMTLYFTLFETVCLFVSAFIVNFLVLDGRSNYLEGALLCAVYVIISVMAFFYPDGEEATQGGGA